MRRNAWDYLFVPDDRSALCAVVALFVLQSCDTPAPVVVATPAPASTAVTTTPRAAHPCVVRGSLPDPKCTPGAVDSRVTQGNIDNTICIAGYTKTVRPPASYTDRLKVQQITAYGYADTNPRLYEEDHLVPLELGGNPIDPHNLWPESRAHPGAAEKDAIENQLHQLVCSGKVRLAGAQAAVAADWTTAVAVSQA